jgi:zona occludens toxin (predicted ATPase)
VVRRVVEEDVATPTSTVVTDDGSWIGRTIVTLVILALLVAGAVWLVRALSDNNGTTVNTPDVTTSQPADQNNNDNNTQPSGVLPS